MAAILDKFLGASPQPTEPKEAATKKEGVNSMEKPKDDNDLAKYIDSLRREGKSESPGEQAVDAGNDAENAPASIFTEDSGEDIKEQFGIPKVPETPSSQQKTRRPTKPLEMNDIPPRNPGSTPSVDEIIRRNLRKNEATEMVRGAKKVIELYEATVWVDKVEFEKLTGRKPDEETDKKGWFFDDPTKNKWELERARPFDVDLWRLHENSTKIDEEQAVKIASMEERMKGVEEVVSRLEQSMSKLVAIVANENGTLTPASQQSK